MRAAAPRALVPLAPGGKGRLASVLAPGRRRLLTERLCAHVVEVLSTSGLQVTVLAREEVTAPPGADEVWRDEGRDLNDSLGAALRRMGAPALVVPSDLPWLDVSDVDRLLSEPGDVVVARSADGGTGALLAREAVPARFGPGSALAHAAAARGRGLRARVVRVAGFERDLDDSATLVAAMRDSPALERFECS